LSHLSLSNTRQAKMFIPSETHGWIFAFVSLVCWGSWSNAFVIAGRRKKPFRFELFYLDFAMSMVVVQIIFCATLGQIDYDGDSSSSLDSAEKVLSDELPGKFKNIGLALAGGAVFNLSNILLVVAIEIAGMAVAFPLGVGTALVIGTCVTYSIDSDGKPELLFPGVALGFIAVCLVALTHFLKEKEQSAILSHHQLPEGEAAATKDPETESLVERSSVNIDPKDKPSPVKTVGIALTAGILMGFWNPIVVASMKHNGKGGDGLSPYASMLWFCVAVFASTIVYSLYLFRYPLTGQTQVLWADYFNTGDCVSHLLGWVGGLAWAVGTTLNIIGGGSVGFAISYALGQAAPAVACLWGLLFWREFDGTSCKVKLALASVFAFYAGAIACIAMSK